MKKRNSVVVLVLGLVMILAGCNNAEQKTKTENKRNIVFILADDLGWNQVGFTDHTTFYETPNIDKIAAEGMIFNNAYAAASICSPARASLMTGKYPARLHITDYIPGSPYPYEKLVTPLMVQALPQEEITMAEMLKKNGYVTGHFGKWHLNVDKNYVAGREGDPGSQGFDDVLNTEKPADTEDPNKDAHKTKLITERTLSFIEKNKDKPFFAYVSFNTVHRPLMERKELIDKYAAKPGAKDSINNPIMGAMIETMDKGIGQLLAKLDELKLTENTLIVFYSDNGGLKLLQDQKPFRGGKAMLFQGGTRVPLAIKCPGMIKPGTNDSTPVSTMDFFPTFAALVGEKQLPEHIDGENIMPLLTQDGQLHRDALYWHYPHYHHLGFKPGASIIAGNYKLIEWFEPYLAKEKGALSLFDISKDPGEVNDLAETMPDKAKELQDKLHQWQTNVGAQSMTLNPNFDEKKRDWRFKDKKGGRLIMIEVMQATSSVKSGQAKSLNTGMVTLLNPGKLVFGEGSLHQFVDDYLQKGLRKLFIVSIPSVSIQIFPIIQKLQDNGVEVMVNDNLKGEPTFNDFENTLAEAKEFGGDSIVGIGGGSVLDVAKLIAAQLRSDQSTQSITGIGKIKGRSTYLACIPTTAGTGSEMSPNAIFLDENGNKIGVISPYLVPDGTYIDPALTMSVPPFITAATGIDALSHCLEAYTNKFAHPVIDLIALEGIRLVGQYLERACVDGTDREAREKIALGSMYGGMCLGPVNTAGVHALAYPLGADYHLTHGLSIALLLPAVMEFNLEASPERHAAIAIALGASPAGSDIETGRRGIEIIRQLIDRCKLPGSLKEAGIKFESISKMATDAMKVQRLLKNNIRELTEKDAADIYTAAFDRI